MFNNDQCSLINRRFAEMYQHSKGIPISHKLKLEACHEIDTWFYRIPIPIKWMDNQEPYTTFQGLCDDIKTGCFKVNNYVANGFDSCVWGDAYNRMRAVHDYFGHYEAGNSFGIIGELSAYGVHIGMFSPEVMPLVFNEIILVNATKEVYGKVDDKFVAFKC